MRGARESSCKGRFDADVFRALVSVVKACWSWFAGGGGVQEYETGDLRLQGSGPRSVGRCY